MSQPALTVMPLTRSRGQRLPPDDCTPDSPDARPVPRTAGTTAVAAAVRLWTARFRGNGGSGGGLAQRAEIWCSPIIRVAGVAGPAVRPSRAENYAAGNPHLVAKQARIGFAQALGGGLVAAIDGMRFVVPVPSAYARPNRKYSGGQRVKLQLMILAGQADPGVPGSGRRSCARAARRRCPAASRKPSRNSTRSSVTLRDGLRDVPQPGLDGSGPGPRRVPEPTDSGTLTRKQRNRITGTSTWIHDDSPRALRNPQQRSPSRAMGISAAGTHLGDARL